MKTYQYVAIYVTILGAAASLTFFKMPLLLLSGFALYLCGFFLGRKSKCIALVLAALLVFNFTFAQDQTPPPPPQEPFAALICGGLVLIVGGIVVWEMKKFCDRHIPLDPPPPPPPTNCPPPCPTNPPTKKIATRASLLPTCFAIAPSPACAGPDGQPYHTFIFFSYETTTNLAGPWTTVGVTNYISQTWSLTSCGGKTFVQPIVGTNIVGGMGDTSEPQRFYRVQ